LLPEKDELDKLLRCEAMINRQLNHAIAELERLQARRKGEYLRNKANKPLISAVAWLAMAKQSQAAGE